MSKRCLSYYLLLFGIAFTAIYRPTLCGFEGDLSFYSALSTNHHMHLPGARSIACPASTTGNTTLGTVAGFIL